MTPIELGPVAERAATELAKRLRRIVPASLLADADGFARAYWRDAIADGWRWRPPVTPATPPGRGVPAAAHADELAAARHACDQAARALRNAERNPENPHA